MDSDRDMSAPDTLWAHRSGPRPAATAAAWMLAGIAVFSQAGCMSALTATTLREALRETAASLSTPHDLDHAAMPHKPSPITPGREEEGEEEDGLESVAVDEGELEKVIDNAVARLSAAGGIDPPTQELLIETLGRTRPEDWAVVVNEFAATLEAARTVSAEAEGREADGAVGRIEPTTVALLTTPPPIPAAIVPAATLPAVAPAVIAAVPVALPPAPAPLGVGSAPVAPLIPSPPAAPVVTAAAIELIEPAAAIEAEIPPAPAPLPDLAPASPAPPVPEAFEPAAQPLSIEPTRRPVAGPAVNNACFATRVRGWGNVERFPRAAFRPGQEVIVYFELDRLEIRSSPSGHTTAIDTTFELLSADDERISQWTFEPIVETCPSPRRDYFARYFLRIPEETKPGVHRLQWSVTDTVAGATRQAHLDLEVLPPE